MNISLKYRNVCLSLSQLYVMILYILDLLFCMAKAKGKWATGQTFTEKNWNLPYTVRHASFWSSCPWSPTGPLSWSEGEPKMMRQSPDSTLPLKDSLSGGWGPQKLKLPDVDRLRNLPEVWKVAQDWWENINWNSGPTWEKDPELHTEISIGTLKWYALDWMHSK